jgi:hypothetical protein
MLISSWNINVFVKHEQSLNTNTEKFGELGLTAGIYLAFKRLIIISTGSLQHME